MTDNRTTELLDGLRNVGNLHEFAELFGFDWHDDSDWTWHDVAVKMADELEQAIAATLGRPKAKSHPYGYERDTGAYDCTRCECGCINDISATYCNDCGGEIEVDESAEKEYYDGYSKHTVFAKKHDDGSLEFCERRYIPEDAATLGSDEPIYDELLRCLENDWNIRASWDGLRKFWCIELTDEGVRMRDAHDEALRRIAALEELVWFMVPFFDSACSHECGCPDDYYFDPYGCDDGCKALKELNERMKELGIEVD